MKYFDDASVQRIFIYDFHFLIVTRCANRWYNSAFLQWIYYFINFVYGLEENDVISSKRQSRLPQVWGRKIKKHCGSGHERLIIYTVEITQPDDVTSKITRVGYEKFARSNYYKVSPRCGPYSPPSWDLATAPPRLLHRGLASACQTCRQKSPI